MDRSPKAKADSDTPDAPREAPIFVDGVAYDVAAWARKHHPGGEIVMRFLGLDATTVFAAFHGPRARKALRAMRWKGEPVAPPPPTPGADVEEDFAALRAQAEADGLFVPDRGYFYLRAAAIVGGVAASVATVALAPAWWPVAALGLGLVWQQAGWLTHDFLHHSVYDDRRLGDRVGLWMGGVVMGFSGDWWKRKHNTHHALPNVRGVDEDIDTLPFLSFSERDLDTASPFARWMVRLQTVTALPVLSTARINWWTQSFLWALRAPNVQHRGWEIASMVVHHAWSLGMLALLPTWGARAGFFLVSQLSSGLMTGAVFLVGHNARPMYDRADAPGFYALQLQTGQNVRAPFGTRWFYGGLDRQIEHHLFPTMPRHHHDRVRDAVVALCKRHNLPYTERGFFEGLGDVARVMARVSRAAWRGVVPEPAAG